MIGEEGSDNSVLELRRENRRSKERDCRMNRRESNFGVNNDREDPFQGKGRPVAGTHHYGEKRKDICIEPMRTKAMDES